MKKNLLVFLGIIILSLITTFIVFEQLSWYHFGDIPTKIVVNRLIVFFIISVILIFWLCLLIIKKLQVNKK